MSSVKFPFASVTERILSLTNHFKDSSNPADDLKNTMKTDYRFQGWIGLDKDAVRGNMVWQEYEPKTWTEEDVDIKV
jgi:alcohol dehydrogenase (NADP+)